MALAAGSTALGQRTHAAPSPAGWPDRAEEWLGPDAVWKRVEWATRVADRAGRSAEHRLGSTGVGGVSLRCLLAVQCDHGGCVDHGVTSGDGGVDGGPIRDLPGDRLGIVEADHGEDPLGLGGIADQEPNLVAGALERRRRV